MKDKANEISINSHLYPVKVMDAKGNVKEIINPAELEERHWSSFRDSNRKKFEHGAKKGVGRKATRSIDEETFHAHFES